MNKLTLKLHWIIYVKPALIFAIVSISAFLNLRFNIALLASLLGALPLIKALLTDLTKKYVVTNKSVLVEHGILARIKKDIPISKINDVTITQSLIQRIFNCGNVRILTGNDLALILSDIDNPEMLKSVINKA